MGSSLTSVDAWRQEASERCYDLNRYGMGDMVCPSVGFFGLTRSPAIRLHALEDLSSNRAPAEPGPIDVMKVPGDEAEVVLEFLEARREFDIVYVLLLMCSPRCRMPVHVGKGRLHPSADTACASWLRKLGSILSSRAEDHEMLLLATVGVRLLAPGGMLVVTRYAASEGLQFAIESLSVAHEEILRRWASDPNALNVKLAFESESAGQCQQWEMHLTSRRAQGKPFVPV